MIDCKIVGIDKDWDSNLLQFQNWNIFQTSTLINSYQKIYFSKSKVNGILFYDNDLLIGALPIIFVKKYLLKVIGSPVRHSLMPFIGLAFNDGRFEDCFNALLKYTKAAKANIFTLTQGELFSFDPKFIVRFQHKIFTTAVISLRQTDEELWKNIKSETRNRIRKGEKNNFEISGDQSHEIINDYLSLRSEMYQKQGMKYESSNKFLLDVLTNLSKDSYRLLSITHDGKLISAGVFLLFNKVCYYWDGVSRSDYNKLCPNNVLHWNIINWAKSTGFLWYDLGGTNTPTIANFKKGYGGTTKEYFSL